MTRRLLYYCPENRHPTGGNKIVYRHVELLRRLGYAAYVVHRSDGFSYNQFSHRPPIVYWSSLALASSDVLVLPEDAGPALATFASGLTRVIFNQNAYYSFRGFNDLAGVLPPYRDPSLSGVLVVSEDSKAYLEFAFPGLRCHRLHISFDQQLFHCPDLSLKRRQICFMARKNSADWLQVVQMLRTRGSLGDWRLVPIAGAPEREVARIMQESLLYLAFGAPEGLSLSNLEAVACGCRVIGYTGMGGREFFGALGCQDIPLGDICAFVRAVEAEIRRWELQPGSIPAPQAEAAGRVARMYSPEREARDLDAFFRPLVT